MRRMRCCALMLLILLWTCALGLLSADEKAPSGGETSAATRLAERHQAALTLLRQGRATEAVAAFAAAKDAVLSSPELGPTAKSRFLYNFGVALEESGMTSKAADAFLKSRQLDPGFKEPVDATIALVQKSTSTPLAWVARDALLETLILQGDLGDSRRLLERVFTKTGWAGDPALADQEINLLAGYLTAAALGPKEFQRDWQPRLARDVPGMSARVAAKVQLLEQAYLSDLPVIVNVPDGHEFTRAWQASSVESEILSRLLKAIGERAAADGAEQAAMALFALSWSSAENINAAVHLVAVLQESSGRLDSDGGILQALIDALFKGRSEAYLRADWPNTFRLHTVLAGIFEQQQRWGDTAEPASAIFQLVRAIRASENLNASAAAALEAVPALHARLARAYKEVRELPSRVLEEYLLATKGYLACGRPGAAETVLFQARRVEAEFNIHSPGQELSGLEDKIRAEQQVRSSATHISDSRITEWILAKLAADPEIRPGSLRVETENRVVTVFGQVDSEQKAFEIDQLVRSTGGVLRYRQVLRPAGSAREPRSPIKPSPGEPGPIETLEPKAPVISFLSPNPVPGANGQQPFTVYGRDFAPGANIVLRDLVDHQEFDHRRSLTFSATQIVLFPNFTIDEHLWSVEVINPDQRSTGQVQFQVVAPAGTDPRADLAFGSIEVQRRLSEMRELNSGPDVADDRSELQRAPGPAPVIRSVSPNPVIGSLHTTRFTVSGSDFRMGANVILRDLTEGQAFDHRRSSSFTSTEIVLNPIFTTDQHLWSVEVIDPDEKSSGQFEFQVLAPR
ncbi:MAG TPA: BON domain-containing protein [Thermoanaerobaculia bacterium]|nr:BON domain-containing protein [Thermoanaerobaculia bacterium]